MKPFQTLGASLAVSIIGISLLHCAPGYAQASGDVVVGPGGSSVRSTTTPTNPPKIVAPTAVTSQMGSGWLTDKVVTHLGQPTDQFTFRVTNNTSGDIKYDFSTGQQFDIVITDSTGNEVWMWSKGQMFPMLVTHLTLKPGQSHSYTGIWKRRDDNQRPVAPGTYTATATLRTMPRISVSRTSTMDPSREHGDPTQVDLRVPASAARAADAPQSGSVEQSDVAQPVTAKTTIVVPPPH